MIQLKSCYGKYLHGICVPILLQLGKKSVFLNNVWTDDNREIDTFNVFSSFSFFSTRESFIWSVSDVNRATFSIKLRMQSGKRRKFDFVMEMASFSAPLKSFRKVIAERGSFGWVEQLLYSETANLVPESATNEFAST